MFLLAVVMGCRKGGKGERTGRQDRREAKVQMLFIRALQSERTIRSMIWRGPELEEYDGNCMPWGHL